MVFLGVGVGSSDSSTLATLTSGNLSCFSGESGLLSNCQGELGIALGRFRGTASSLVEVENSSSCRAVMGISGFHSELRWGPQGYY